MRSSSCSPSTLPRSRGCCVYSNGSDIHRFMPRSRSLITKIGVCSRSARSNARQPNSKHSATDPGSSITCRVSPWPKKRTNRMSPWEVRVGRPVLGPMRCTSQITTGTSAKKASPANSAISERPGHGGEAVDRAPAQPAVDGAQGGGGRALDQDLALGLVFPADLVGVGLFQVAAGPLEGGLDHP